MSDEPISNPARIRAAIRTGKEVQPALEPFVPTILEGKEVPPRIWAVQDWIPWGSVTGLYGDGGMGKTLIAQQLQTCTALGRSWFGLETKPLRSLGVYCEDSADELHRRQAAINFHYGCKFTELGNMAWLSRLGEPNILISFENNRAIRTDFFEQVLIAAKEQEAQLVVIDTVADTFGGNENDRGQVRQYVQSALGHLALAINGAVVACAHPSRAGLASGEDYGGSTGWSNAFRSRLTLQAPPTQEGTLPDADARILTRRKANYASRLDMIPLVWSRGVFVRVDSESERERPAVENVFLALLDEANKDGRPVSAKVRAGNYAPAQFMKHPARHGYTRADFERAMNTLFHQQEITVKAYGSHGKERESIERIGGENGSELPF